MAHVGALIELSNHVPIKSIKEWMGVSAGSFVAMCICIGFTLEELLDFSCSKRVSNKRHWLVKIRNLRKLILIPKRISRQVTILTTLALREIILTGLTRIMLN